MITTEWRCDRCGRTARVKSLEQAPIPLPTAWTRDATRDLCGACSP